MKCDECLFTDGSSLAGLRVILQVGQAVLQGARRFPSGQCPRLHVQLFCAALSLSMSPSSGQAAEFWFKIMAER